MPSTLNACLYAVAVFQIAPAIAYDGPYLQVYPPVNASDDRIELHFALMLSFGGDYTSIGALPGVQIALDYINSQTSILPGYTLHYTLTDSQVEYEYVSSHILPITCNAYLLAVIGNSV